MSELLGEKQVQLGAERDGMMNDDLRKTTIEQENSRYPPVLPSAHCSRHSRNSQIWGTQEGEIARGCADAVRGEGKGEAGDLGTLDEGNHNCAFVRAERLPLFL